MKSRHLLYLFPLLLLAVLLSACAGGSAYGSTSWPGIAANQDTVFLADNQRLYAINLADGSQKWSFPEKTSVAMTFFAAPVLTTDGQLLAPSYDHKLYSLDPATGSQNWVFDDAKDRLIASPLVTENRIYQASADGSIYALTLNGQPEWVFKTGGPVWATPTLGEACGCLYVASMDHRVYAVNAETGSQIWVSEDTGGAMVGSPAYDPEGLVFVGTFADQMLAFDATSGQIAWRFDTEGWIWSGPQLVDGVLYFGDLKGYLYAVNAASGSQVWRIQPNGPIVGSPVVQNEQIYFTSEADTLYIASLEGDILQSKVIGGYLYAPPVVISDTILVAPNNSDILLASLTGNGNQRWTFTPAK